MDLKIESYMSIEYLLKYAKYLLYQLYFVPIYAFLNVLPGEQRTQ